MKITQIDSSAFPKLDVYFSAYNEDGTPVDDLKQNLIKIIETTAIQKNISNFKHLNNNEAVNFNLVMDTSGSMNNGKLDQAKNAASDFLKIIKFSSGDLVELLTFSDMVSINHFFSSDADKIRNSIFSLRDGGQTAFYDALNTALIETSKQKGPKCVIAFTDGADNKSTKSYEEIIDLSKKLSIPIYIVGIGNEVNVNILQRISTETGGYFTNIYDINKLKDIYKDIFTKQKEQYVISFTTDNPNMDSNFRDLKLEAYGKYKGFDNGSYVPKYLIDPNIDPNSINYKMSELEKAMYNYQHSFVKAIEKNDFTEWAPYIDDSSEMYKKQQQLVQSYKTQNIKLTLLFFNITKQEKIDDNNYRVEVYEKFYITYGNKKPAYKEFKNTYIITKRNGVWKVSDLPDIKTISDITVNY